MILFSVLNSWYLYENNTTMFIQITAKGYEIHMSGCWGKKHQFLNKDFATQSNLIFAKIYCNIQQQQ